MAQAWDGPWEGEAGGAEAGGGEAPVGGDAAAASDGEAALPALGLHKPDPYRLAAFLFGLARGRSVGEAAGAAGLCSSTLYYRRRRCAQFARAWREAMGMAQAADEAARRQAEAGAGAAESGVGAGLGADGEGEGEGGRGTIVAAHPGRGLIRRRKRAVAFDRERKQAFLDHFAGSCNLEAAARAAGISLSPVYRALHGDPAFADGFAEALAIGYRLLEAEALRQQRADQAKYRIEPAGDPAGRAASFQRTMQLLGEYHRGLGRIGRRPTDARRPRVATNAEVAAALETRLKAFYERVRAGEETGGEEGAEAPPGRTIPPPPPPPPPPSASPPAAPAAR